MRRIVFDTTTVVSALCFPQRRLAWLRTHWRETRCTPLISSATAAELVRVLQYPKFRLSADRQRELLADYIPVCEAVRVANSCPTICRDPRDQPFLDLAYCGNADILVSGEADLVSLGSMENFVIETPEAYRQRVVENPI